MSQPDASDVGTQDNLPPNTSIAAGEYQPAIQQQPGASTAMATPSALPQETKDVVMSDSTPDRAAVCTPMSLNCPIYNLTISPQSPANAMGVASVPSPVPPRTGTPGRNTNGSDANSRATSQHPDPAPTIPREAPPHGASTRQYLNSRVTRVVMDGMKLLAKERYVSAVLEIHWCMS